MKYKALMLDVDGTLIPYDYNELPTDRVAKAVQKAQEKVTICLVTGRSYGVQIGKIVQKLQIKNGYLVSDNGAHVVNLATEEILYEQPINPADAKKVLEILADNNITFFAKTQLHEPSYGRYPLSKEDTLDNVYMFYAMEEYSLETIERLSKELSVLPEIALNATLHKDPALFGINISHVNATKLHGVEIIMKELNLQREEVIAVGDSYNDFPLLMAAGTKVAMGNAIDDLKAVADYVAPPVTEDGVAHVIEKFILTNTS